MTACAALLAMLWTGQAGAQTLPAGWASQDLGATGLPGSAAYSGGTFTVRGAGADIWGTADSFHFANQLLAGDGEIVARVASMGNTHAYAKAGVMIRETLTAGARHVILDMKPSGSVEFMTRAATGGTTAYVAGGTGRWLRLVRSLTVDVDPAVIGHGFVELHVNDGTRMRIANDWLLPGPAPDVGTRTFMLFGLPAGSYSFTAVTEGSPYYVSSPARINVSTTPGTAVPPTIRITNPAENGIVVPGTLLTAVVSDPDTPVVRVDYYAEMPYMFGPWLVGSTTASPYAVPWPSVDEGPGEYWLFAVATDASGLATATTIYVRRQ